MINKISLVNRMKFVSRTVQVIKRTNNVKSIRFEKPEHFSYLPGQWTFLIFGEKSDRFMKPLSFSSSPTEDYLEVTKKLTGLRFSELIDDLEVGDTLSLDGPYGNFSFLGEHDKVCMLSGGIGITPLLSMIKFCTDKKTSTDISLLYSNRNEDEVAFEEELAEMQKANSRLAVNMTITNPSPGWKGLSGRVNAAMIKSSVPQWAQRVYYISGPQPMVESMIDLLKEMGLDRGQIKHEYFTGYKGPDTGEELVE